jgi:glycerol 2-dehydrogenase (NADP+)
MTSTLLPLNTGASIPALGFGTWQSPPGQVEAAVYHALKVGYRHIDCAFAYQNEEEVGAAFARAFKEGIVKREDIFVTTKLWCTYHTRVEQNLDESLKKLGLEYVDLYLMHWPVAMNPEGGLHTYKMRLLCCLSRLRPYYPTPREVSLSLKRLPFVVVGRPLRV